MPVHTTEIKEQFRSVICEDLAPVEPADLTDDLDLTQGILDSFGLVVVFQNIENAIGRELKDSERVRDTVRSLNAIAAFIDRESAA